MTGLCQRGACHSRDPAVGSGFETESLLKFVLPLLAAFGLFAPSASPVAAQGRTQALPPLPDAVAAEFPAIGRLGQAGFRTRQGCTATLVAPQLIVTAAHCVSAKGESNSVFVAGWSRGDYIAARETGPQVRHPAYGLSGGPDHDLAYVVLDSPIEDVTPIPLARQEAGSLMDREVALIGYHRQTPHILSGDFACPVSYFRPGLYFVGCPVINGNSGAPIMTQTEAGDWQVVGIISSRLPGGAIAVELPDWLFDEIATRP